MRFPSVSRDVRHAAMWIVGCVAVCAAMSLASTAGQASSGTHAMRQLSLAGQEYGEVGSGKSKISKPPLIVADLPPQPTIAEVPTAPQETAPPAVQAAAPTKKHLVPELPVATAPQVKLKLEVTPRCGGCRTAEKAMVPKLKEAGWDVEVVMLRGALPEGALYPNWVAETNSDPAVTLGQMATVDQAALEKWLAQFDTQDPVASFLMQATLPVSDSGWEPLVGFRSPIVTIKDFVKKKSARTLSDPSRSSSPTISTGPSRATAAVNGCNSQHRLPAPSRSGLLTPWS